MWQSLLGNVMTGFIHLSNSESARKDLFRRALEMETQAATNELNRDLQRQMLGMMNVNPFHLSSTVQPYNPAPTKRCDSCGAKSFKIKNYKSVCSYCGSDE